MTVHCALQPLQPRCARGFQRSRPVSQLLLSQLLCLEVGMAGLASLDPPVSFCPVWSLRVPQNCPKDANCLSAELMELLFLLLLRILCHFCS